MREGRFQQQRDVAVNVARKGLRIAPHLSPQSAIEVVEAELGTKRDTGRQNSSTVGPDIPESRAPYRPAICNIP